MCPKPFSLLLLLVLGFLGQGQGGGEGIEGCPVSPFGSDSREHGNGNEYHTSRYSRGDVGKTLVERLRTKSEKYYQNVVDNVIMYACDVEYYASKRCVDEDLAAKSWSGECINAADHECPLNSCESSSNWQVSSIMLCATSSVLLMTCIIKNMKLLEFCRRGQKSNNKV